MNPLEQSMRKLEKQTWLDGVAKSVQEPVHSALHQMPLVKDALHGKWLGHPLHPAAILIPAGAWTTALALDLLGGKKMRPAADFSIAFGLAGATLAAASGLADWSDTKGEQRRTGAVHAALNTAATALYVTSLALRKSGSRRLGVLASVLGYGVVSASAYIGGHMAYGQRLGMDHSPRRDDLPTEWTDVMADADLPELSPRKGTVNGIDIVVVRHDQTVRALANTCSHRGGPLAEGRVEGDGIRCPWHGSRFCLTNGEVLDGPATMAQPAFDTRVREGRIEVRRRDLA